MSNGEKLVSVVIPYYNDKEYLKYSIESVLNQTYKNFELILLNHASTDGSDKIADSYNDPRIIHVKMDKNLSAGGGVLLLKALEYAKGKYLKLFCADDIMVPECIEKLVNYLESNTEKDFVFSDMDYVNSNGQILNKKFSAVCIDFNFEDDEIKHLGFLFTGLTHIPFPSVLMKKNMLHTDFIDMTFIMLFDISMWTNFLIAGYKLGCVKESLVLYRVHEHQVSRNNRTFNSIYGESIVYCDLFYKIKDISVVKNICKDSPYVNLLSDNDIKFIPFIIAHYCLTSKNYFYRLSGYIKIHDMFSDNEMKNEIEIKFKFGIKEFRDIYADRHFSINDNTCFKLLVFLLFKKIQNFIIKKIKTKVFRCRK